MPGFRDHIRGITRPDPDVLPVDPEELRLRLMRLNDPASPWQVRDGTPERVDVVAEWKMTDSGWKPILTKVGADKTFSTRLRFHTDVHEVRSKDRKFGSYTTTDSNGFADIDTGWQEGQLQDVHQGTVNGQHYRFEAQDFKNALKQTVLGAGWTYRAVVIRKL